jgi:hypothetical protein
MHEVGPVVCDYIKIEQNGKPKRESLVIRTLRWDFLEIAFLLNRTRGFVQAKKQESD